MKTSYQRTGQGDGLFKMDLNRPTIKNPTICPKCKTVYSHSNELYECNFCNYKNKKYDLKKDIDDPILSNEDY